MFRLAAISDYMFTASFRVYADLWTKLRGRPSTDRDSCFPKDVFASSGILGSSFRLSSLLFTRFFRLIRHVEQHGQWLGYVPLALSLSLPRPLLDLASRSRVRAPSRTY